MSRLTSFTPEELQILRDLIRDKKNNIRNNYVSRLGADEYDDEHQAPETYIALVPSGGIPAATGPGGSALTFAQGDLPGSASCEVYQIINGVFQSIDKSQTVYNLSSSAISQSWVTIMRDKFGRWIAQTGGGGSSCEARNEVWLLHMIGTPLGGSFDLTFTVNASSDTITIDYDSTAAEAKTAFELHSGISSGDITVLGGNLPFVSLVVTFGGDSGNQEVGPEVIIDLTGLSITPGTGTIGDIEGLGVIVTIPQPGFAG